jgi:hypothetical protein
MRFVPCKQSNGEAVGITGVQSRKQPISLDVTALGDNTAFLNMGQATGISTA